MCTLPLSSVSFDSNSTIRVPSLLTSFTVTRASGLLSWLIFTTRLGRNSLWLGIHADTEQAAEEVARSANTSVRKASDCDFIAVSWVRESIYCDPLKF